MSTTNTTVRVTLKFALINLIMLMIWSFTGLVSWENIAPEEASKEIREITGKLSANKAYSFRVTYSTYKDYTSGQPHQVSKGKIIRDGINYRSEAMGKLVIQNRSLRVTIDSIEHIVKVDNPAEELESSLTPGDCVKLLKACKHVKYTRDNVLTGFRFEMKTGKGLVAQELFFDHVFIRRMVYYYANEYTLRENNHIKEEIIKPRVSIDISDFKIETRADARLFNTDELVTLKKGKVIAAGRYNNYKVVDGRYKK